MSLRLLVCSSPRSHCRLRGAAIVLALAVLDILWAAPQERTFAIAVDALAVSAGCIVAWLVSIRRILSAGTAVLLLLPIIVELAIGLIRESGFDRSVGLYAATGFLMIKPGVFRACDSQNDSTRSDEQHHE